MKTIVCERPNKFIAAETEVPEPTDGEALVRIRRIGICGTDMHAYKGNQPFFEYPRISATSWPALSSGSAITRRG